MKLLPKILLGICLVLGNLFPTAGLAEEWIKPGEERFFLSGGVFLPSFDTNLSVDNKILGAGLNVDLEDDLGLKKDETTFWSSAYWRFAAKHRISVGYAQFNRDATKTITKEITIGDEVYPVGASLASEFKIQLIPISYAYSFMKREKFELAGSIGLHWTQIDFDVQGSASLGDQDLDSNVSANAPLPLPLIGLRFDYHFTPRWSASLFGAGFALNIDTDTFEFSGSLLDFRLSTEYWFFNNVGAGAAVNWFKIDADVDTDDWGGGIDYNYWGPQVYLTVRF